MTAPKKRFPKIKGRDHFGVFPQWREPADWRKVPFTHTITQTTCYGMPYVGTGKSLFLVEDRAPCTGELFIWCQKSFDEQPTAPVWGRFMGSTAKGDKVLTTMGDVVVLRLGPGPLPTKAEWVDGPAAFDVLHHAISNWTNLSATSWTLPTWRTS